MIFLISSISPSDANSPMLQCEAFHIQSNPARGIKQTTLRSSPFVTSANIQSSCPLSRQPSIPKIIFPPLQPPRIALHLGIYIIVLMVNQHLQVLIYDIALALGRIQQRLEVGGGVVLVKGDIVVVVVVRGRLVDDLRVDGLVDGRAVVRGRVLQHGVVVVQRRLLALVMVVLVEGWVRGGLEGV